MSEEEGYQELSLEEMRDQLSALQSLVKSPGWELLVKIAEGQIGLRENIMNEQKIQSVKEMCEFNYVMGERDGIRLWTNLPTFHADMLQSDIVKLAGENEDG